MNLAQLIRNLRSTDTAVKKFTVKSFLESVSMNRNMNIFVDEYIPYTTPKLLNKILKKGKTGKNDSICVINTIEWAIVLYSKGYQDVTLAVDKHDAYIEQVANALGYKYLTNILQETNMEFDAVIGNPPYNMKNEKGGTIPLASKFNKKSFQLAKKDGIVALVTSNTCMGPGQQTITPTLFKNETLYVSPSSDGKAHFGVGQGICVFIVKMTETHNDTLTMTMTDGKYDLDKTTFNLKNTQGIEVPYFPKYTTMKEIDLLAKIVGYTDESFQFRSSLHNKYPKKTYFGFRTVRKVPASPRSFRYNVGPFEGKPHHPCAVDYDVTEDVARSVFCSKMFHWVLNMIVGPESADAPANLSYFPEVPLNKVYTHNDFKVLFNLTEEENQIILDWANKKPSGYWDEE